MFDYDSTIFGYVCFWIARNILDMSELVNEIQSDYKTMTSQVHKTYWILIMKGSWPQASFPDDKASIRWPVPIQTSNHFWILWNITEFPLESWSLSLFISFSLCFLFYCFCCVSFHFVRFYLQSRCSLFPPFFMCFVLLKHSSSIINSNIFNSQGPCGFLPGRNPHVHVCLYFSCGSLPRGLLVCFFNLLCLLTFLSEHTFVHPQFSFCLFLVRSPFPLCFPNNLKNFELYDCLNTIQ